MRHNIIIVFLFSLTLLAFGAVPQSVKGQEPPSVRAYANAPGWITVIWEHTGQDVYYFLIQRQDPPYTDNSIITIAQSYNRTDSLTDKNLNANTVYKYRVCAVYAYSRTCTDWVSVRTLSPPPSPSGGSSGSVPPPPARTPLATPEITATRDQDPKHILLDWSGDPGWQKDRTASVFHVDGTPWERTTYKHPQLNNVVVYRGIPGTSKYTNSFYDARKEEGPIWYGNLISLLSVTSTVRPNTAYTYKVCFTSRDDETKCSKEITASGKPVAPTAPADVTVSQGKVLGNPRDLAARIRTFVTARWRNTDIPGQYLTLEREDRVQLDRLRVGPAWVEIKRINVVDPNNPIDPTEFTVDTTPDGPELLTKRGNNYRVCAVVPSLGAVGKVCSAAVSAETAKSPIDPPAPASSEPVKAVGRVKLPPTGAAPRPICDVAREARARNSPAAPGLEEQCRADLALKGATIANLDPTVAAARAAEGDVGYRQGFDIATGIFGDPALGAKGNTATGPGSLKIRDSLSAAGQRGFNASVKLHLSRKY